MDIKVIPDRIELILKDGETLFIIADYGSLKVTAGYANPLGPKTDVVSGPMLVRKEGGI